MFEKVPEIHLGAGGSRGQREKLGRDAVATEVSANSRDQEAGLALWRCPSEAGGWRLCTPLSITGCSCLLGGEWGHEKSGWLRPGCFLDTDATDRCQLPVPRSRAPGIHDGPLCPPKMNLL